MEIRGEFLVIGIREFWESREFSDWSLNSLISLISQKKLSSFVFRLLSFYYLCKAKTNFMIQTEQIKEIVRRLDTLGRCL